MTIVEMYDLCKKIFEENHKDNNWDGYRYIGLRFEDKEREIGEICECSKHNSEREDEREFPEYGTEEYEEMEELDGTSAWDLSADEVTTPDRWMDLDKECSLHFDTWHCYIIAGNDIGSRDMDLDHNEIVIKNAKVISKIF